MAFLLVLISFKITTIWTRLMFINEDMARLGIPQCPSFMIGQEHHHDLHHNDDVHEGVGLDLHHHQRHLHNHDDEDYDLGGLEPASGAAHGFRLSKAEIVWA